MKKIHLLIILIFALGCSKTEVDSNQSNYFIKFFGSSGSDAGYDVTQTSDGGYVLIGSKEEEGYTNICIIKTDKYGNKLWEKTTSNPFNDVGNALIVGDDNSIYAVGTKTISTNNSDIYVTKLNQSGNEIWENAKTFGGIGNQEGNALIIDSDNNIVVAGSSDADINGNQNNVRNIIILKLTTEGDSLVTNYGTSGNLDDYAVDILQKTDGHYIILGNTISSSSNKIVYNPILCEFRLNTDIHGVKTILENNETIVNDLAYNNGFYFIAGNITTADNGSDIILYKLQNNVIEDYNPWRNPYEGANNEYGNSITINNNNITIGGYTSYADGSNDIYILSLSITGEEESFTTIGGTGDERANQIQLTTDGGFIFVGSNIFESNSMITLIKTDEQGQIK